MAQEHVSTDRAFRVFVTLVLTIALWLCARFALPLHFADNDDVAINLLLSGGYSGTPEPLVPFQNIFLTRAIAQLYQLVPSVDWYPTLLLGIISLSFAGIMTHAPLSSSGLALNLLILAAIGATSFILTIQIQYTTVAGIAASAGALMVLRGDGLGNKGLGILLIILAFALRFEAAALVLLIVAPTFLASLMQQRSSMAIALTVAVTVAAAIFLNAASDREMVRSYPDFTAFNELRGKINDNPLSRLEPDRLPEAVSENDYRLLRRFFADSNAFEQADLEAIRAEIAVNFQNLTAGDWLGAAGLVGKHLYVALAMGVSFLFALTAANKRSAAAHFAVALVIYATIFSIEVTAIMKDHILISVMIATLVGLLIHTSTERVETAKWLRMAAVLTLALIIWREALHRVERNAGLREFYLAQAETFADWPGDVIVFRAHLRIGGGRIYSSDFEPLKNKVFFAGWLVKHPANAARFDGHDSLLNPGSAMFFDVEIPEDAVGMVATGLKENYGADVSAKIVSQYERGRLVSFGVQNGS